MASPSRHPLPLHSAGKSPPHTATSAAVVIVRLRIVHRLVQGCSVAYEARTGEVLAITDRTDGVGDTPVAHVPFCLAYSAPLVGGSENAVLDEEMFRNMFWQDAGDVVDRGVDEAELAVPGDDEAELAAPGGDGGVEVDGHVERTLETGGRCFARDTNQFRLAAVPHHPVNHRRGDSRDGLAQLQVASD